MIIAKHAKKESINNAILDIGEKRPTKGAKVFAVLKGAVDGGLNIPHEDNKMPDAERLSGGHIAKYKKNLIDKDFEKLKTTINKWKSDYNDWRKYNHSKKLIIKQQD